MEKCSISFFIAIALTFIFNRTNAQAPAQGTVTFKYQTGTQTNSTSAYADFVPTSGVGQDGGYGYEFITQGTGTTFTRYVQVSFYVFNAPANDAMVSFDRNSVNVTVQAAFIRSARTGAATTQGLTSKPVAGGPFKMQSIDLLAISGTPTVSVQAYSDGIAIGSAQTATINSTTKTTIDLSTNSNFYSIDEIGITGFNADGIRADNLISTTAVVNTGAPAFSYAGPQVYTQNAAITPLVPTGTGGAIGAYGPFAAFASVNTPSGVEVDLAGNVYVSDAGDNSVYIFNSAGTNQPGSPHAGSGSQTPYGIDVDALGNFYIANGPSGTVTKITSTGIVSDISGFTFPTGVCVDASNNVYVSDLGDMSATGGAVYKILAGSGTASVLLTGFNNPSGIAVNSAGDIFVAQYPVNNIIQVASGTSIKTTFVSTGLNSPYGLAFGPAGNLYVADEGSNTIKKITPAGVVSTVNGTGLSFPYDVAFDSSGNMYITDYGANTVKKSIASGYSISPALPAGLYFSNFSGTISGTPTAPASTTTYTITGTNAQGSSTATVNITVNLIPPAISYATPQVYTVGTAIIALNPANTGGTVTTGGFGPITTFASVSTPYSIIIDASNNVYVTDDVNGDLYKYNSAGVGGAINTTLSQPTSMTDDAAGNIYVSNFGNNTVCKYSPTGTLLATITGFNAPYGMTTDASNNVYVVNNGTGSIIKIAAGTTTTSTFLTGFTNPYGIDIDASGNMFVSQVTSNSIIEVAFGTTTHTTFASGFNGPRNIQRGPAGNLYVADYGNNAIKKITPGGTVSTVLSGLSSPRDVDLDASGNLFVADYGTNTIKKSLSVGYTISPALPAGLSFNSTTGAITGTPTTTTGATSYTITGYNPAGSSSTTVSITVNSLPYGNYAFSKQITLNTTSLGITSNLANFPALLSIQSNDLIISGTCTDKVVNPNGPNYDFAFVDPNTAGELNYQVESYNQATGTLLVWVQILSLTYAANNTLSFNYGSKSPTVTHNAAFFQNTWASDYKAIFHFNEAAYTGSVTDGTNGGHTGTTSGMTTADLVTGKIGTAYSFDGSSKKITTNAVSVTGPFTISAWVKLGATGIDQKIMTNQATGGGSTGGYKLGVYTANIPESESGVAVNRPSTPNPTAFSSGAWHYVQGVYTGTTLSTYVDGSQYKILTTSNNPSANLNLYIGVGEGGTGFYFNGIIDEPRVSNVAKTADWIKAEYGDQNNPATFTSAGATATNIGNAAVIPGSLTYTWTGATSNDAGVAANWNNTIAGTIAQLPAFDGSATLVIPAGLTNYPGLTADASLYGLTIASGASLNLNGHTLSVACNIYNSSGGQILSGGNILSQIIFNGSLANQTYTGTNTASTAQIGKMTINNTAGGTVTITSGPLDIYNTLTITQGNLAVGASPAALTLKSTGTLTASVATLSLGSTITGTVNVERFITGSGALKYRGYRLFSSPVYASSQTLAASTGKVSNLMYLNTASTSYPITTGAAGGGFDKTGNPSIYLYREDRNANSAVFSGGNFIGVSSIIGATLSYNTYNNTTTSGYLPVGNGVMFFFRGSKANLAGRTTLPVTVANYPDNVTVTQSGALNQGTVPVILWYNNSTANSYQNTLSYTTANTSTSRGFNLVGNPYASSIDWSKFSNTVTTSPIYGLNVNPTIYELDPATNIYGTYNQATNTAVNNGNKIISSGEGFFVQTSAAGATLQFTEAAKSSTQLVSGSTLLMGTPVASTVYNQDIRLNISKDSTSKFEILVGFNSTSTKNYNDAEDDRFYPGQSPPQSMWVTSGDNFRLVSKWLALPKASQADTVNLTVNAVASGRYTITRTELKAIPALFDIWLIDKYKKDSLDIKYNTTYIFDIDRADTNSYGAHRFQLVIRQNPALGIHLLQFTAKKATKGVQTVWKTENEQNYTNFTVERSSDKGKTFDVLGGFVSGALGTYSFLDKTPPPTTDKYRLKIEDLNGAITYSNIVTVIYGDSAAVAANHIMVYPNPANGVINLSVIRTTGNGTGSASNTNTPDPVFGIKIMNITGSVVKSAVSSQPNWQDNVANLMPGTYIIEVLNNTDKSLVGKTTFVKL